MMIRANEVMLVKNRLTQIGVSFRESSGFRVAVFECDCGTRKVIRQKSVGSGNTKSCGCINKELLSMRNTREKYGTKHGGTGTREYRSWAGMKSRCKNPNNKKWKDYGGRGISVCQRWIDSFEEFLCDMGVCPKGMTLDRRNTNGNCDPKNCRWATYSQQATT